MIHRNLLRVTYVIMTGLILFSVLFALATNNIVPITYLTDQSRIVTANDLKPAACSAITLTAIRYCPITGWA